MQIREWRKKKGDVSSERMVIDVVIPSYRVNEEFLRNILNLRVPAACETTFHVIVDNPKADVAFLRRLEAERPGKIRVRVNNKNMGASEARNVSL